MAIGSSPRSRGTVAFCVENRGRGRFIPALAGNGEVVKRALALNAVHPRARGERTDGVVHIANGFGSSPRSRGTVPLLLARDNILRFIPALAGNGF